MPINYKVAIKILAKYMREDVNGFRYNSWTAITMLAHVYEVSVETIYDDIAILNKGK